MDWYWIVKRDETVIAALAVRFYEDRPGELVENLKEFSKLGPLLLVCTDKDVRIGEKI